MKLSTFYISFKIFLAFMKPIREESITKVEDYFRNHPNDKFIIKILSAILRMEYACVFTIVDTQVYLEQLWGGYNFERVRTFQFKDALDSIPYLLTAASPNDCLRRSLMKS